jgi:hypothetical protein
MRARTLSLLLAALSWFPVTSLSNDNSLDPALPNPNSAIHLSGKAVFGVDVLGRFAIAMDTTDDGVLDHFWQFTADKYLPGPWFKASEVRITYKQGRLVMQSLDDTYFVGLSVKGEPPIKKPASTANSYAYESGVSLLATNGVKMQLASFEPMELKAWPPGFFDSDMLNPQTGPACGATPNWYATQGCACGGPGGGQSCSIGGCSNPPTSLSITCKAGCSACCNCVRYDPPPSNRAGCFCMGPQDPPE